MALTHDELLTKVDSVFYEDEGGTQLDLAGFNNQYRALRAVVELHPIWTDYKYTETDKELVEFCGCCQEKYPCLTIQAIEKELSNGD